MPPPFAPANSASGTHVYLFQNPHLGLSRTLPRWQSVSPFGNQLNALGLPVSCYDSAPGFTVVMNDPLALVDPSGMDSNYAGLPQGFCPPSKANCLIESPFMPLSFWSNLPSMTPNDMIVAEARYEALIAGLPDPELPKTAPQHGETIWVHCAGSWDDFDCSPYPWSEHLFAAGWQPYFSNPIGALFRGNRQLWSNTAFAGNLLGVETGVVMGGLGAGELAIESDALIDGLFGRVARFSYGDPGINAGLLNNNNYFRIGYGWDGEVGSVFRISIWTGPRHNTST